MRLEETFRSFPEPPPIAELFKASGYNAESIGKFYMELASTPELRSVYEPPVDPVDPESPSDTPAARSEIHGGRFRLHRLHIAAWKNLENYEVIFDPDFAIDVILGWNGTGKSNLFESLVIIFRDLYEAVEKDKLPKTKFAYGISYEIEGNVFRVEWNPEASAASRLRVWRKSVGADAEEERVKRGELGLPKFIFGYYSGPTNRLADWFLPAQREHYYRLVESEGADRASLMKLLEERRFFCAETHHAKYVLLAFFYKEDAQIANFLRERLRIVAFASALFVVKKPRWARKDADASTFWGARGVVRAFLEKLRSVALAPLILTNTVDEGYRKSREDHYYFYIPDISRLRLLASEYPDSRSFFVALESADFSQLFSDVLIAVKVQSASERHAAIVFREMSEGEQQLLTVLGLLRFTKSRDSLILLDEPDTHLNPHWAVDYLRLLEQVMSDSEVGSSEQRSSQLLVSTHDPLVISNLVRQQIHLLKRDWDGHCYWEPAQEDPKGLGFAGILMSDMFGFRSDLDADTLEKLDKQAELVQKDALSSSERAELATLTEEIDHLGFQTASSDPYYAAFLRGLLRSPKLRGALASGSGKSSAIENEVDKLLDDLLSEGHGEH
jgi:predicted ATPase